MVDEEFERLLSLLAGKRLVALTGAGMSTESGIPDYRGPGTRARARNPMQIREFLRDPEARRRYWARSYLGFPRFSAARANRAHVALSEIERSGALRGVITQNVDRLHREAGSERVVELHGSLERVRCLGCGAIASRRELQSRLAALNPTFGARAEMAPDGDAELPRELTAEFEVAACERCGDSLRPDVVFFGENVPKPIVDDAFALLDDGEALLVAGTSLAVFSGLRFVRRAREKGLPIAVVCLGETRGDELATLRVSGNVGEVLPRLGDALRRG